jgi:nucleotidyltransferase/DNA polymerase involved in DNA repair
MNNLPIRKIPGIGKVMETTLHEAGIQVCGDVIEKVNSSAFFDIFNAYSYLDSFYLWKNS